MAKKSHKRLLMIAGVGVGGYLVYRFVYVPWKTQQTLGGNTVGTAPGGLLATLFPSTTPLPAVNLPPPTSLITAPTSLPAPISTGGTLGPKYGGVLGACLEAKPTWSPSYCQQRLDGYVSAAQAAKAAIANLQGGVNPAAAGIPAAQAQLALEQAAFAAAKDSYDKLTAAGDPGAAQFSAAMIGHQNDINDLTARIAAASTANDNSAAITAWEGQLAALDHDYFNLTGAHLTGGV